MRALLFCVLTVLLLGSCANEPKQWQEKETIELGSTTPIGIASTDDGFWISDGDHNRLVKIDPAGKEMQVFEDLQRPMHIDFSGSKVYFPEYGSDSIKVVEGNEISAYPVQDTLNAPAGISVFDNEMAIADFYTHRVFYYGEGERIAIGKEGKDKGDFYYPTDVQITHDKIFVADAYNNRVQVFDKKGNFLQAIGELDDLNGATGLYVDEDIIYVTDLENDRVVIYDIEGNILQEITEGLNKPVDLLVKNDLLYIANYRGKNLKVYQ